MDSLRRDKTIMVAAEVAVALAWAFVGLVVAAFLGLQHLEDPDEAYQLEQGILLGLPILCSALWFLRYAFDGPRRRACMWTATALVAVWFAAVPVLLGGS